MPSWNVFAFLGELVVRQSVSCASSGRVLENRHISHCPRIVLRGMPASVSISYCARGTVVNASRRSKIQTHATCQPLISPRLSPDDEYDKEKKEDAIILRAVPFSRCEREFHKYCLAITQSISRREHQKVLRRKYKRRIS